MTILITTQATSHPLSRVASAGLPTVVALLILAGCGGDATGAAPQTSETRPSQQQTAEPSGQPPRIPGASGVIAAIDGTTLQVQSATAQTAVTYNGETTFTQTVSAARSDIAVGSCVMVRSDDTGADPADQPTEITATSVSITASENGECAAAAGGGRGGRGSFTPPPGFTPPTGGPGGRPSGAPRGGFGGTFGKVVAADGAGFIVESARPSMPGGDTDASPSNVSVTTTDRTTYTKQTSATAAALQVGLCVTARGEEDATGTVVATSIALRPKADGSCDAGFGPGGFGGPAGGAPDA